MNQMPASSRQLLSKVVFGISCCSPLNSNSMKSFTELGGTMTTEPARTFQCVHSKEKKTMPSARGHGGVLSRGAGLLEGGFRNNDRPTTENATGAGSHAPSARYLELGYGQ